MIKEIIKRKGQPLTKDMTLCHYNSLVYYNFETGSAYFEWGKIYNASNYEELEDTSVLYLIQKEYEKICDKAN
jgi:hypothetical protein